MYFKEKWLKYKFGKYLSDTIKYLMQSDYLEATQVINEGKALAAVPKFQAADWYRSMAY